MNITEKERMLLEGSRRSDFGDAYEYEHPWTFDVIDHSGLEAKEARGVLSSLERKGLIRVLDPNTEDSAIEMTGEGRKVCDEYKIERKG